ncbi:hypothetical protein Goklo_025906, partial [Gossypium klotzschianum]|nr:hypothetical protein [Gossypium klotzschianum]
MDGGGKREEDCTDGVFHGGNVDVASGIVSAVAGVYSMCDGPALSHGPYLGTVALCSFVSILVLSVKACVFTVNSQIVAEASSGYSLARQRLHFKKSWGMPVLFLSSVVFALGHIVVAYRTCCRARRKLLFHRVDPE